MQFVIRDIRFYLLFCQYHRDSSLADSVTIHLLFLETQAHMCAKVSLSWEKMENRVVSLYYLGVLRLLLGHPQQAIPRQ